VTGAAAGRDAVLPNGVDDWGGSTASRRGSLPSRPYRWRLCHPAKLSRWQIAGVILASAVVVAVLLTEHWPTSWDQSIGLHHGAGFPLFSYRRLTI